MGSQRCPWELIEPQLRPSGGAEGRGRPARTRERAQRIWWVLGMATVARIANKYPRTRLHRRFQHGCGRKWKASSRTWPRNCMPWKTGPERLHRTPPSTGAKKGARGRANQTRKDENHRSRPMITVFLSPLVSKALRRTKANSSKASRHSFLDTSAAIDRRQSLRQ